MSSTQKAATITLTRISSEALSSIFTGLELSNADNVQGQYRLLECSDVSFVRARTQGGLFHVNRRARNIRTVPNDDCFICLPLAGEAMLNQYGRDCRLGPGDLGLLDAAEPYGIEISSGCDALWVRLPRGRLEWRPRALRMLTARKVSGERGIGHVASRYIRTFFEQAPFTSAHNWPALATTVADLVSEATCDAAQSPARFKPASRRTLDRACIFIERHLCDEDLSPAVIAAGVGISQRYLGDLFAREGETTMGHVIRRRLERCREALEAQEWQSGAITQIAFAHGFINLSSFNRMFKAAFGSTPKGVMLAPPSPH